MINKGDWLNKLWNAHRQNSRKPIQEQGKSICLDMKRYPCKCKKQVIDEYIVIHWHKTENVIKALNNVCKCKVVHQAIYLKKNEIS